LRSGRENPMPALAAHPNLLSTRKTSRQADFGASVQCGSRTDLCVSPRVLASHGVCEASRPPEDAVPFTVVPVMVPMRVVFRLFCGRLLDLEIRRLRGCSGDVNHRPRESEPSGSHRPQVQVWRSEQGCRRSILDVAEPGGNILEWNSFNKRFRCSSLRTIT